jgi:hypothetical protein
MALLIAALAAVAPALPGVGAVGAAASTATPCGASGSPPGHYDHVIWIWMENHSYSQVLGSSQAPFETALAQACGSATAYHDVGSPSLPNYIAATSGGTQGVNDDGDPAAHALTVNNIFRQVRSAGERARSYLESMPGDCRLVDQGAYWAHHNPAAYYVGAVPNLVIAPHTPAGTRFAGWADHYALLRTTEDLLGLSHLGRAATAPSLRGPFRL